MHDSAPHDPSHHHHPAQVKAARYALSKDPKGQAKGGTVGARYAAAQLGVPESQSVREWMKRLPEMEDALERAQAIGGESASRHTRKKKSMSRGRVRKDTKSSGCSTVARLE